MKKLMLITIGILMLVSNYSKAQVSVNINIGSPPEWGPIGYTETRYYYLPDVEAYYDIHSSHFIYYDGGIWLHKANLPYRYRNYDLYSGYKVVMIDYHGDAPYSNFKEYKVKYKKGYKGPAQKTIGMKPGKGKSSKAKTSQKQQGQKQQKTENKRSEQKISKSNADGGSKQQKGNQKGKKK